MKKRLFLLMTVASMAETAAASGRFEVYDFGSFRLHVYHTDDALQDASFIVEGSASLVTFEHPLFKEDVAAFDAYAAGLGKPVEQRIADYHVGGTGDHATIMPEGMPAFSKGAVYDGMMQGFVQTFGDAIVEMPTGSVTEVAFGSTHEWAGTTFEFRRGASSDFPAASILIGGKVYYTHWAPVRAHMSPFQLVSPEAIDAELAEARNSLASGAELFIGGHGGAATRQNVEFKIAYLEKMKEVYAANRSSATFVAAMRDSYPELPGADGLEALARILYKE